MAEQISEINQAASDSTNVAEPAAESPSSGWDLRSIFTSAVSSRAVESGAQAGRAAALSKQGQEMWNNLNVCNPKTWTDYIVGGVMAGGTFVYCTDKYLKQKESKPSDSK